MRKLLKYLKPYAATVAVIIGILVVQAYCDLSLPTYTSDIVNVGIQQGGIDDKIPEALTAEEMEKLLLFTGEEDAETVKEAYSLKEDGAGYDYEGSVYVLSKEVSEDEEKVLSLAEIMGKPMFLTAGFESESDMTKQMEEAVKENMKSAVKEQAQAQAQKAQEQLSEEEKAYLAEHPETAEKQKEEMQAQIDEQLRKIEEADMFGILQMMPEELREEVTSQITDKLGEMPESIVEQAATAYIRSAYEKLGMDGEKMQNSYILRTGGKMLALAFLGMMASVLVGLLASRVAARTGRDLRGKVFRKVVGFSNAEFDKFSTASLITRSTNDIQQIQMLVVMLLRMVLYAPIMAIGGIVKVFHTNADMSWIIALGVLLIFLIVMVLFTVAMPRFKVLQNLVDRLNLVTREILTGLPVIRAFSTEKYEEQRFDKANRNLTKTNLFVNRAMTFMMPTMMLVMNGITVLIVWVGASGVNDGKMQVGDMMAFIQYTMQIIMAFLMICMISIMLPRAAVAAGRVDEILTSTTAINDPEEPEHARENGRGEVVFDHVSFRYPGAKEHVLEDISFTAKPGQTTAIIGSTGSGKSTLLNLIPRFYDVTEGRILLDGQDIRSISQHDLRDRLGYVPQKGVLFSGTIASNILYGNPSGSEEEMKDAAAIAQAEEFIDEKPKGYLSTIAQGGANVSGGQKQRLSIARAIAKNPKVFLFDDSFSALDFKTDFALRSALKKKTKDSAVIIVAQRISTILNAEQILVLDDGKIAGKGTHKELLRTCDAYYQITASQLSEAELARDMEEAGKEEACHE